MLGSTLIERWEMWKPTIDTMGNNRYPLLEALVGKMRSALTA